MLLPLEPALGDLLATAFGVSSALGDDVARPWLWAAWVLFSAGALVAAVAHGRRVSG